MTASLCTSAIASTVREYPVPLRHKDTDAHLQQPTTAPPEFFTSEVFASPSCFDPNSRHSCNLRARISATTCRCAPSYRLLQPSEFVKDIGRRDSYLRHIRSIISRVATLRNPHATIRNLSLAPRPNSPRRHIFFLAPQRLSSALPPAPLNKP